MKVDIYKSGKVLSVNRQIVVVTSRQIRCIKLYKTIKCLLYLNAVLHLLPSPQLHLNLSQQFWVSSPRKCLKFDRDLVKTLSLCKNTGMYLKSNQYLQIFHFVANQEKFHQIRIIFFKKKDPLLRNLEKKRQNGVNFGLGTYVLLRI